MRKATHKWTNLNLNHKYSTTVDSEVILVASVVITMLKQHSNKYWEEVLLTQFQPKITEDNSLWVVKRKY